MGVALLYAHDAGAHLPSTPEFDRMLELHPARLGQMKVTRVEGAHYRLAVWTGSFAKSPGFAEHPPTGSWLALVGNPTRGDLADVGPIVVERLLEECVQGGVEALGGVSPPFAAVFYDGRTEQSYAAVDRFGFQHLYLRQDGGGPIWLSSSSLALARGDASTLDHEAVAEWLAIGHFMSGRTFFREIRKLGCGERLEIGRLGVRTLGLWQPAEAPPNPDDPEDAVRSFTAQFLASVSACSVGPGLASELTGGIDSRLLLGAILEEHVDAFTWTQAQRSWAELGIIDRLRRATPFDHYLALLDASFVGRLPQLVDEMTELTDGESNALVYAPLLISFDQLESRREASLSGVAGEIARGFYFGILRSERQARGVPIHALVNKETRPAASLRQCFRPEFGLSPVNVLQEVVEDFVEASPASSPEGILEDLYIRARLQRFAGRNFTMTGYFCRQGLPYFGHDFVDHVLSLPFSLKTDGWILRRALMDLNPALAKVPLNAGMAVAPASRLRPDRSLRRTVALGRRAAAKYGGTTGRRLAGRGVEMVPWSAARSDADFRGWVSGLLLDSDAESAAFLDRTVVADLVEKSFRGANVYPLGLLVTLEITLRKVAGPRAA